MVKLNFQPKTLKFNVRTITVTCMLTAMCLGIIIAIISYTPIVVFPTFRLFLEGLLIRTVAFLYGPVIGIITSLVVEFWINLLRPSFLHWGYFLSCVCYGFFAGIGYLIRKYWMNIQSWIYAVIILISISGVFIGMETYLILNPKTEYQLLPGWSIFTFNKYVIIYFLASVYGLNLITLIGLYLFYLPRQNQFNRNTWLVFYLMNAWIEYITCIFLLPIADFSLFGTPIVTNILCRIITAPVKIIFDTIINYAVITTMEKYIIHRTFLPKT